MKKDNFKLLHGEQDDLMQMLKDRFEKNMHRHKDIKWKDVESSLKNKPGKLWSLKQMETTDGEPDVTAYDKKKGAYIFYDCAAESPKGRRSFCYDREALDARKENKPINNAMEMAAAMGIEILTEQQYRELQSIEKFDLKTSSWILTPAAIRKHGGALFCDRRYDAVFVYHNGAESYYAARGFRGLLSV